MYVCTYFDIQRQKHINLNKTNVILKLTKDEESLIVANTNKSSQTWHEHWTNSSFKQLEEYLLATHVH
jgi:hypothetical protein